MDRQSFALMIPILALMIPVVAVLMSGIHKMMKLRIEEARVRSGLVDGVDAAEIEALRADLADTRLELDQVHERLDFTERLLVEIRDRQGLAGGAPTAGEG
jgi:hypothetical protein